MVPNPFPWLRRVPGLFISRVMTQPLDGAVAALAVPGALTYRLCEHGELRAWSQDPELDLNPATIVTALARGDRCVGAFDGGRLVGYVWYAFGPTPDTSSVWVRIPGGGRYAYKGFIRRSFRSKGLGRELYTRAGAVCPREGRTFGITYIYADNIASIRPAEKAGWRTVGFAGYLERPGLFAPFQSAGARSIDFGFFRPECRASRLPSRAAGRPAPVAFARRLPR